MEAPSFLTPLLKLGQRSYEVYLTHVFVIFAFLAVFLRLNRPIVLVPAYFLIAIIVSGILGEAVAQFYSEPANRWLRGSPLAHKPAMRNPPGSAPKFSKDVFHED